MDGRARGRAGRRADTLTPKLGESTALECVYPPVDT
jgi:hypothetical protein